MAVQESIEQYKELNDTAEKHWQLFVQSIELSNQINISSFTEPQICQIKTILSLSEFVTEQLCRHPQWVIELTALSAAKNTISRKDYTDAINALLTNVTDLEEVKKKLRDFRNKQMVRLAWMDYTNAITIEESLLNISALAESLVIAARDWLYTYMCSRYGTPMDDMGKPQPLMILGMGKLGGRELNYSSDIDLIFAFPEHGETQGARRSLENQEFFIRMAQKLINLLDQVTQDGFVYRVDMRLRPYGESGPLVVSFSALEDYYQEQGRDWERYALIKARALGPWTGYSDELHSLLRPFIYRRYIDYSAIDALRKMKQLIVTEVRRRQLDNNIKLGPGGIREAEFVVQSFQLIRGGQEPSLRQQSLLTALDTLQDLSLLDSAPCSELKKGYLFLRRIENLLQSIDDKQTQTLPSNVLDWQRLCYVLNVKDESSLSKKIHHEMSNINHHFCATIGGDKQDVSSNHWTALLWNEYDDAEAKKMLAAHGLDDEALWPKLSSWRENVSKKSIGPRGRETLDKLLPRLLEELFQRPSPCHAFEPVSGVLDKILTRTTYLELLLENPNARQQLIHLCYVSPWIAKELANFPILLDDLINSKTLYKTLGFDGYKSELHQYLLRIPQDDMEQQMEALRQFKLSQQLKIAAADVTGVLPVMKVSDHLTYLAEAIIEKVVILAWQQMIQKYGIPDHLSETEMGFAVIAYGKLGGIELGYGSDLDLVFLHNAPASGNTLGDKSIGSSHFYLKLAQRILHLFSTRTVSGELYEVDMRLRPSGASGLLVSEIENFGQYQQSEAWTWEHQALVRARYVFGDLQLKNRFAEIRASILSIERDKKSLANDVNSMREKMREHLLKVKPDLFDLKQSKGGIADIEFIVQYLVLAYSHQDAGLTVYSDNVRILDYLSQLNIMTKAEANKISNIYCLLRDKSNSLILLEKSAKLPAKEVQQLCEPVVNLYNALLLH